ncbi:MAG TPA: hypothetical protein VM408_08075, partial [Methylomirabilota bacterium]|nr:hypothetical protein [Methylomirabilota bacterium]
MLKRRSRWLAGAAGLFLVLSMSGVAMGVTPPDAVPDADTTATFEDVDGNGIDDDCQAETAVEDPAAVTAEQAAVDTDADGVISTTEAAHSARIGGKNCNHGGYVSWIAHQNGDCATGPTAEEPTAEEPAAEESGDGDEDEPTEGEAVLVVTTPPDAEPDADSEACDEPADEADTDGADADSAKKDHKAAAAARLAAKAERKLARAAAKAERTAAKASSKT